jgi:hypothetical protein
LDGQCPAGLQDILETGTAFITCEGLKNLMQTGTLDKATDGYIVLRLNIIIIMKFIA